MPTIAKWLSPVFVGLVLAGCATPYTSSSPENTAATVTPNQSLSSPTTPSPQTGDTTVSLADTINLCKAVQEKKDLPIGCQVDLFYGKPAMIIAFQSVEHARNSIDMVAKYLGAPFCTAANKSRREALLVFVATDTQLARLYSCASNQMSDWFSLATK